MRTHHTALLSLLASSIALAAPAFADVGDERLVFTVAGGSSCRGGGYDLIRLVQNADGTTQPATSWSVPVGAILEITDVEFEAPYNLDVWPRWVELRVVGRWNNASYTAWRHMWGSTVLGSVNAQTLAMAASTLHQTDVRRSYHHSFGSGILINAHAKPCFVTGVNGSLTTPFELGQVRIRGRLHADDDMLFPPVLQFSP